jgi:hypothetical protein
MIYKSNLKTGFAKFQKGTTLYSTPEKRLTAPIEVTETYAVDSEDLKIKLIMYFLVIA